MDAAKHGALPQSHDIYMQIDRCKRCDGHCLAIRPVTTRVVVYSSRLEVGAQSHTRNPSIPTAGVFLIHRSEFWGGGSLFRENGASNWRDFFFVVVGVFQKGGAP